jgi:Ca-activated chloride channel family protein
MADAAEASAEQQKRATQQWLQRIPDDPGGLMRRKFLYQYRERGRQQETDRPW